jgi:hypothetical protein
LDEWDEQQGRMIDIGSAMTTVEKAARETVKRAASAVDAAVGLIVQKTAESRLQQLLREPFVELLDRKLLPSLYGARFYARYSSRWPGSWGAFLEAFEEVAERLRFREFELDPHPRTIPESLREQGARWTDFGHALVHNSDAIFL